MFSFSGWAVADQYLPVAGDPWFPVIRAASQAVMSMDKLFYMAMSSERFFVVDRCILSNFIG